jgi:RecA-family ATPase
LEAKLASQAQTVEEFLELIYGEQEGYSYSPYRDPKIEGDWTQCFFKWPEEKEQLIKHITTLSSTNDVYYSPALYKVPDAKKESYKTTRVVWAEFDGKLPNELGTIPPPSIRVRSSTEGHEHWYWLLDFELQDAEKAEAISGRLSYALEADHCWNANRVLRPPGSTHIETSLPVRLLYKVQANSVGSKLSPEELLQVLPVPPIELSNFSLGTIPEALDVVARYKWSLEVWEFFKKKEQPEGSRSSALARLASDCIEMGMQNNEIYSILATADLRWKKFAGRNDRRERLIGLVKYARSKAFKSGSASVAKAGLISYSFKEFLERPEQEIVWVVPNLISRGGGIIIASEPGLGKTQISMQAAIHMALGKDFIGWKIDKQHKILMYSLEMGAAQVQYFMKTMRNGMSEEEYEILHNNFHIIPLGEQLRFDSPEEQNKIEESISVCKPDGIIIDSFGRAIGGSINSDEAVLNVFRYVDTKLKKPNNSFVWFVHHTRKPQVGNKKPKNLSDLYGNQYIGAWPDTAFSLWPSGEEIELSVTKNRLGAVPPPKFIKRTDTLSFQVTRVRDTKSKTKTATNSATPDEDDFLSF